MDVDEAAKIQQPYLTSYVELSDRVVRLSYVCVHGGGPPWSIVEVDPRRAVVATHGCP
jgi:hypothetical protein